MLRIESYVTPIILSYVDKYIKNLKPEDSKVSLWGGDAVFNNLDLRLDVLEQELNSPFTFISGHIHELRIHVPWTKLTSESIVITINTIECILKLKDADEESDTSSQSTSTLSGRSPELRKRSRIQDIEVPASYVQGLMNRIINNVCIVCNNLILKYVEDDIVLSINAKTAEFRSVDQNWLPCFQDLTPEALILRSLVSLTDLTVCLDRRNASGKIEIYQEPLLYRCSFNCRIERNFPSAYSHQPTLTRCDCFCPQLHFSLSDSQLPMFFRILQLLYALYYGQLQTNPPAEKSEGIPSSDERDSGSEAFKEHPGQQESWSSWAWNVGTSMLPVYWDDGEELDDPSLQFRKDKILHFGMYVELVTWSFKLTEQSAEGQYSVPTKTRFVPFLTCQNHGNYFTVVLSRFEAASVQFGISFVTVDPHGYCICGLDDSELRKTDDDTKLGKYVRCGENKKGYLAMSLFEDGSRGDGESWNYSYAWEEHRNTVTESYLLEKTPAFGVDFIYILDINRQEMDPELFAELQSSLEYSNLKERSACRIILGASEMSFNSGLVHRLCAIKCALDAYEYSPYAEFKDSQPPEMTAPCEEEVNALESLTPLRTLSAVILESSISLQFAQHPRIDIKSVLTSKNRKKNQRASCELSLSRVLPVPCIRMKVAKLDLQMVRPFYPYRLVKTACRMRNPAEQMLKNCHIRYAAKVVNATCFLQSSTGTMVPLTGNLAGNFYMKSIVLPKWWMGTSLTKDEILFESDQSSVWLSIPQIRLISLIVTSWSDVLPNPEILHSNSLCYDAIDGNDKFIAMMVKLSGIDVKYCHTVSLWGVKVLLSRFSLSLCQPNQETVCVLASGPEEPTGVEEFAPNLGDFSQKLAKCSLQIPVDATRDSSSNPHLLTLVTHKMAVVVDPIVFQWIKYTPRLFSINVANALAFRKISEVRAPPKAPRKSSDSSSTKLDSSSVTLSETKTSGYFPSFRLAADAHHTGGGEPWPKNGSWKSWLVSSFYPVVSHLLISVDVETVCVFMPVTPLKLTSSFGIIDAVYRAYLPKVGRAPDTGDTLAINLPHIQLKNSSQKVVLLENAEFPIIFPPDLVISDKDKLPWSLSLTQCQAYSLQNSGSDVRLSMMKSSSASATLSMTPKLQEETLSQLGLVIHVDMSPLNFLLNQRQVEVIVTVMNNFLKIPSVEGKILPQAVHSLGDKLMATAASQSSFTVNNPTPRDGGAHKSSEERKKDSLPASAAQKHTDSTSKKADVEAITVEKVEDEINVTTWIQWTLAKVSVSLFAFENNRIQKLKAGLEDLTLSVDAQYIYCKVVAKVANVNVKHYEKSASGWTPGSYEGVILTTGSHFSRDLKIVKGDTEDNGAVAKATSSLPTTKATDSSKAHGFLSVTMTVAQSTNVYGRWNQVVKKHLGEEWFVMENQKPSVLCEIDSRVASFDMVLHLPVLRAFVGIWQPLLALQISKGGGNNRKGKTSSCSHHQPNRQLLGMEFNSSSVPLIYFQSETVRVFLPAENSRSTDHDLLFAQIDLVTIAPQVENPLPRSIIREDIYKAAELARILGVPGSNVEDRQYQLDLVGFSLSTGAWKDVTMVNNARPRSSSAELLGVRGENPALEWNNCDPNAQRVVSPIFIPLIARFNTRVILAPAIVYKNADLKSILVAGHSVELNVTSDFHIYASMEQLLFLKTFFGELSRALLELFRYRSLLFGPSASDILDSGVDCEASSVGDVIKGDNSGLFRIGEESTTFVSRDSCVGSLSDESRDKFVPFDVLLTGSKIILDFYDKKVAHPPTIATRIHQKSKLDCKGRAREKKLAHETVSTESEKSATKPISSVFEEIIHPKDKDAGYDGSEEESVCEGKQPVMRPRLVPILHLAITQPHVFLSCHSGRQQFDLSYFDMRLKSVPVGYSLTDESRLPRAEDCFILWLETRPGDVDLKTGVPPAFFTASAENFLLNSGRIEVKFGRPVKAVISDAKLNQFRHLYAQLKPFIPATAGEVSKTPSNHAATLFESYLATVRRPLSGISHVTVSSSQLLLVAEVNKSKKSELHVSLQGSEFGFRNTTAAGSPNNPEVMADIACRDIQLKTCYRALPLRSLVKPFTFRNRIRVTWTTWRTAPYVRVSSDLNLLHVCLGPENVFALIDCFKHFEDLCKLEESGSQRAQESTPVTKDIEGHRISFNDDLRAGMFLFVTQSDAPLPYQVAFDQAAGRMTWCYPEPRALLKVEIYPVPFVSAAGDSHGEGPSVECILQYYDEMIDTFVNYKHFQLSESRFCHLDLPGGHEKRLIVVSHMWRVTIEDASGNACVSPQALAACVRVDSLFSVSNLPAVRLAVTLTQLEVHLINHVTLTGTRSPAALAGYHLEPGYQPECQPFCVLSVSRVRLKALSWHASQYAELGGGCRVHLVNYRYLTLSPLAEVPHFVASVSVQHAAVQEDGKKVRLGSVDGQLRCSALRLAVSPASFHTLTASERCWRQAAQIVKRVNAGPERPVGAPLDRVMLAAYVICNGTLHSIVVSQVGTNEVILIKPGSCISYAWRSQLSPARLKISSREWRSKQDVSLDKGSTQIIPMQKSKTKLVATSAVIVSSQKLSEYQSIIKICGTIVIANDLDRELQFALLDRNHRDEWYTLSEGVAAPHSVPLSFIGLPTAVKVRYHTGHAVWSSEIPVNVELSREAFPVRLMSGTLAAGAVGGKGGKSHDGSFVLCRIVRKRLSSSWRILVTFCPQFVVRSHLPRQMTLILDNSAAKSKQHITVKGRGKMETVNLDSSHLHHISFQLGPTIDESKPPISVTKTMLEQIRASESTKDAGDIDKFMDNFSKKTTDPKWPYVDPFYASVDFLFADQPKIDLQIGFSCLHPQSDTVVMDVRPWALIINHTDCDVILREGNLHEDGADRWYISPGAVFAPNKLDNTFHFGVLDGEDVAYSPPLQLHCEDSWYALNFEGKLPKRGTTNISVQMSRRVCHLTVMSRCENAIQLLHLVPTYSIVNKTTIPFEVKPLTVKGTRRSIADEIDAIRDSVTLCQTHCDPIDVPLLFWHVLIPEGCAPATASDPGHPYLSLGAKSLTMNPVPVRKLDVDCRVAFTTTFCSDSLSSCSVVNEPFLLTVHPDGSRVKFVVRKDPAPQMLIYNLTAFTIFIAQNSLTDSSVMAEEVDCYSGFSSVPSAKKIYYSFPHYSSNFPNLSVDGNARPKLHLSTEISPSENRNKLLWSLGIDITAAYDHFVVVPRLGDVKLRIEKVGRTTHIFVDAASRVEISAKDIRSRITVTNKGLSISQEVRPIAGGAAATLHHSSLELCGPQPAVKRRIHHYGTLVVQELSLSLRDDRAPEGTVAEVMRLTVDNLVVNFRPRIDCADKLRSLNHSARHLFEVVTFAEHVQLDNQLYSTGKYDFPVVLIGQRAKQLRSKILDTDDLLTVIQSVFNNALVSCTVLLQLGHGGERYVQSMDIACKPFFLFVEDYLMYSLYQFCKAFQYPVHHQADGVLVTRDDDCALGTLRFKVPMSVLLRSNAIANPIACGQLQIGAISVLLSVHASAKVYLALDQTPLSFGAYASRDIVTTGYALGYNMTMHYASSVLFRAGWVISSLNLLGNPGGFARTVGSGMKDFVQLPYEGIVLGPWAFIAGITNGSLSLLKHFTAGTLMSVTNLANSVARNMERLAMDEEHLMRNEANRRLKRQGLSGELKFGLSAFGISLLGAIGGIVHQPMQALMADGLSTSTLVSGVGKGLIGVVAKPVGGAADLLMHAGQGLLQGAGWSNEHEPRSKPSLEEVKRLVNSDLKYLWKFAIKGSFLCSVDATVVASDNIMSPVTILIDSEHMHIICTKTDRVGYELFDFLKVSLRPSQVDPTLVVLEEIEQKEIPADAEGSAVCPERIAEYVRSACSEGVAYGEVSSDESSAAEPEDTARKVRLALSPPLREYLISVVELSSRRAKGLGFEC